MLDKGVVKTGAYVLVIHVFQRLIFHRLLERV